MKNKTPLFVVLIVISISCKKINLPNNNTSSLIGKWHYISSGGGMTGAQHNQYGHNTYFEFEKNGTFKIHRGLLLTCIKKYKFELKYSIYSGNKEYVIIYKNHSMAQSFSINGDTLCLRDEAYDAYSHSFIRKH